MFILYYFLILFEIVSLNASNPSKSAHTNTQFNITAVINKQVKLPCFIQNGRKYIWMHVKRDEILSIDNMVITPDRRFSIEKTVSSDVDQSGGCWVNLVINSVNLNDESVYICQIDTMSSSRVNLNILGT